MGKVNAVKTLVIELRYSSQPDHHELYCELVDGINDIVGQIAHRFSLDILSLSHVIEASPGRNHTAITCTAVCSLNAQTRESVGKTLEAENNRAGANLYCFLEAYKLSVRVAEIKYN